jgi:hypothetical protein
VKNDNDKPLKLRKERKATKQRIGKNPSEKEKGLQMNRLNNEVKHACRILHVMPWLSKKKKRTRKAKNKCEIASIQFQ